MARAPKRPSRPQRPVRSAQSAHSSGPTPAEVLAWLARKGTHKGVAELARYGIDATRPFGVPVGELKRYAKAIGRDHALAQTLWASGRYEARLLACMIDEPERVTAKQMDAWAKDFDNWGLVDTVCFHLFDRAPHAWKKVAQWAKAKPEFEKRTSFALMWSLSVHDAEAADARFLACLPLIERAATDERHFVKKPVDMALRAIGKRNATLNRAALATAKRLASSDDRTASWIGRHAARELTSAAVKRRLAAAARKRK